jgi:hypothetical protein
VSTRRHQTLRQRIDDRHPDLERLVGDFGRFVQTFATSGQFVGPSVYFHAKAIEVLRRHRTAVDALSDDLFFDYLYATLTSWGLHRMGPGNTRLRDIDELKASFRAQAESIERLQQLRIEQLGLGEVGAVAEDAWQIMTALRVGIGETLLVANSKALHHLLPGLIPPIDRNYTLLKPPTTCSSWPTRTSGSTTTASRSPASASTSAVAPTGCGSTTGPLTRS